jgi:hypothetical protein
MEPAVEAFEQLAPHKVQLGPRHFESFVGLIHSVHQRGGVFLWEMIASTIVRASENGLPSLPVGRGSMSSINDH